MRRPRLNEIELKGARSTGNYLMVGEGEWDAFIQEAYNKGVVLVEFGPTEIATHAYKRADPGDDSQLKLFGE